MKTKIETPVHRTLWAVCGRLLIVLAGLCLTACDRKPAPSGGQVPPSGQTAVPAQVAPAGVLESGSGKVGPQGGEVALAGGIRVVFPAGAVDKPVDVTIRSVEPPKGWAGAKRRVIRLDCQPSPMKFARDVEVRVPLPPKAKAADQDSILAGVLNPESDEVELVPVLVKVKDGKAEAVALAQHFSMMDFFLPQETSAAADEWLNPPPESCEPIQIGYYGQGESPECMTATLQMATKAVNPYAGTAWQFMEAARLRGGTWAVIGRFLPGISDAVEARTHVRPIRYFWNSGFWTSHVPGGAAGTMPSMRNLITYLKRTLSEGRPVVLFSSAMGDKSRGSGHAVVLVGYDSDGQFWAVNPQSANQDLDPCVPTKITTDRMLGMIVVQVQPLVPRVGEPEVTRFNFNHVFTTLEIPAQPSEKRSRMTLNITPGEIWFEGAGGKKTGEPICAFAWDGRQPGGAKWLLRKAGAAIDAGQMVDVIDPDMTRLCLGFSASEDVKLGGMDACNSYPQSKVTANLVVEIANLTDGGNLVKLDGGPTTAGHGIEIPAGKLKKDALSFGDILSFCNPGIAGPQEFEARVTLQDNRTADIATFRFKLELPKTGRFRLTGVTHDPQRTPNGNDATYRFDSAPGKVDAGMTADWTHKGQALHREIHHELSWDALPATVQPGKAVKINARAKLSRSGDIDQTDNRGIKLNVFAQMWNIKPAWHSVEASGTAPAGNQEFTIEFPKLDLKTKFPMPVLEFQVDAPGVGRDVFKYQYEWEPPKP